MADELERGPSARERLRLLIERWPADGDGEAVLWMELWVRALHDAELAATREKPGPPLARGARPGHPRGAGRAGSSAPPTPTSWPLVLGALMDGFAIQVALRDPTADIDRVRERCLALAGAQLGCELRGEETSWSGNEN